MTDLFLSLRKESKMNLTESLWNFTIQKPLAMRLFTFKIKLIKTKDH